MLLGDGAKRIRHVINLEDGRPSLLTATLSRIEKKNPKHLARQVFVYGIDGTLDDVYVPQSASSDIKSVKAGLERGVMLSALPLTRVARISQAKKSLMSMSRSDLGKLPFVWKK